MVGSRSSRRLSGMTDPEVICHALREADGSNSTSPIYLDEDSHCLFPPQKMELTWLMLSDTFEGLREVVQRVEWMV